MKTRKRVPVPKAPEPPRRRSVLEQAMWTRMVKRIERAEGTPLRKAFTQANRHGDVTAAVALAAPVALEMFRSGGITFEDLLEPVATLAGASDPFQETDLWFEYGRHVAAAFTLGLAMGRVVRSEFS